MRMWSGQGVYQWENSRQWTVNATSEFCRADGALVLPGFSSLSVFFRRQSQTGGTMTLALWTAPIYYKLLDDDITANTAPQLLFPLAVDAAAGLTMPGTGIQVFGGKIRADQPMGSLLFWEMRNAGATQTIVGDIYIVPNFTGSSPSVAISRTVDIAGINGGGSSLTGSMRSK